MRAHRTMPLLAVVMLGACGGAGGDQAAADSTAVAPAPSVPTTSAPPDSLAPTAGGDSAAADSGASSVPGAAAPGGTAPTAAPRAGNAARPLRDSIHQGPMYELDPATGKLRPIPTTPPRDSVIKPKYGVTPDGKAKPITP